MKGYGGVFLWWGLVIGVVAVLLWTEQVGPSRKDVPAVVWVNDGRPCVTPGGRHLPEYVFHFGTNMQVELGLRPDGVVVWRIDE